MSYRELSMIEVKEVLRRREAGQGLREIARETGLDRKTVRRYVLAADEAGADEASVQEVVQRVQARPMAAPSEPRQRLEAHRGQIAEWLSPSKPDTRALRLTKVHVLLARRGVDVTYATLCRWAHDELGFRERKPTVRVDDPDPGHEAQVDFGKMGMLDDPTTGKRRTLWCLVVTLSFSRMQFAWPTFEQTTEAVVEGLDAAWRFFGGVARRVVPDNTKAIIVFADRVAPRPQESFAEYAQTRGFFVDPARVRKPRDKARVENQVQYVRHGWFAGSRFDGLTSCRQDAERWCRDVAGARIHGTTRKVPRELFEQVEQPKLLPAPTEPFDVPRWSQAKVHPDHHIQVQRALYSLPTAYIGRTVRVRIDRKMVRIYLAGELIKIHPRQAPGGRSTDAADYPPGKAAYALRSVDGLITRAHKIAPHVGQYAEALLGGAEPWIKMRQGYQLLRLCEQYGAERVDAVCRTSLEFDVIDVPRIARMLKSAQRTEHRAEKTGKLHKLPAAPRFARSTDDFSTRTSDPDGGAR